MTRIRKPLNITIAPVVREAMERYCEHSGKRSSTLIEERLRAFLEENHWLSQSPPIIAEHPEAVAISLREPERVIYTVPKTPKRPVKAAAAKNSAAKEKRRTA